MTAQPRMRSGPDSLDSGAELANFVRRVVTTAKPRLVVEERGALRCTLGLAQGLNENRFGKLITCDSDANRSPLVQKEIAKAGFSALVEVRNQSALESKIEGNIDLLFASANYEQLVERLLPQINPFGLILLHGSEDEYEAIRELALRMEKGRLVSVVLLPRRLRLVMAQKRSGRK